jgi:transcriptional regulator with GAF, ATPase, and Fis domain
LKVLVLTLLTEIESLENRIDSFAAPLNLQEEVHRFEAALIRVALNKTGGRQRRAARLLGTKVTTLNTKIRRYGISVKDEG